ncbi:MAG: YdcF family protein [Ferruginibacter sp.]|nr:YdcF family protein [Ferruginibacter sp.]
MVFNLNASVTKYILVGSALLLLNSCFYSSKTSRKLLDAAKSENYDLLVVPGVPFEDGKWSRTMKGRVYWSKFLFDHGIAKNIMYSGSSVYSPYYEGMIMALYAEAIGIPKKNIYYETRAEHSTENIYYSYQLAKDLGFTKVALASDRFQTRSLRRFTRNKVSPDIAMLPMVTDTVKFMEQVMVDPEIDSEKAFNKEFISIKKREGIFKRLKGTLGLNIKKVPKTVTNGKINARL